MGLSGAGRLAGLTHRRWMLPVLAELWKDGGSKFVTLHRRLAISRGGLGQTLEHGIGRGWIRRNTGYGHPMRPEYLATERGERIGEASAGLMARLEEMQRELDREHGEDASELFEVVLAKWSLPVLVVIAGGADRFSLMREAIGESITDRALARALADLQRTGLIERRVDERSLRPRSGVTASGSVLVGTTSAVMDALE